MTDVDDELRNLRRWKAEATQVLIAWDRVWVALDRPGALGTSKAEASEHEVERLRSITQTRHRLRPHAR